MSVVLRLALSFQLLVAHFYDAEMKRSPCVPHSPADEIRAQTQEIGRHRSERGIGEKKKKEDGGLR